MKAKTLIELASVALLAVGAYFCIFVSPSVNTKDKESDPTGIWKSEIFGRSLDSIVQEGIQSKISMMPDNIRFKLQNTLTKIVNKGSNNMIAIVL